MDNTAPAPFRPLWRTGEGARGVAQMIGAIAIIAVIVWLLNTVISASHSAAIAQSALWYSYPALFSVIIWGAAGGTRSEEALNMRRAVEQRPLMGVWELPQDHSLALASGATLDLWRRGQIRGGAVMYAQLWAAVVACAMITGYVLLPPSAFAAGSSVSYMFRLAILTLPGITGLGWLLWMVWYSLSRCWYHIHADDLGIAVSQPLMPTSFIAWQDIRYVARMPIQSFAPMMQGTFNLLGDTHSTRFKIVGPVPTPNNPKPILFFDYIGGLSAYRHQAQRLLATIVLRSGQPIRQIRPTLKNGEINAYYRQSLPIEPPDPSDLPSVNITPEPSPPALPLTGPLELRIRLLDRAYVAASLRWIVLLIFLWSLQFAFQHISPWHNARTALLTVLIIIVGAVPLGLFLPLCQRFGNVQFIRVDPVGIADPWHHRRLAWGNVRSWTQQTIGSTTISTVRGDTTSITWKERPEYELGGRNLQGDRRAAYQERAAQIRAQIAAHTGLRPTPDGQ